MTEKLFRVVLIGEDKEVLGSCLQAMKEIGQIEPHFLDPTSDVLDLIGGLDPHLVLSELIGPPLGWRSLLAGVRKYAFQSPLVFIGPQEAIDTAIDAVREGADDFISLPSLPKTIVVRLQKALENRRTYEQLRSLQQEVRYRRNSDYIVGGSKKIQAILGQIVKMSTSDISVLITGESGTGKELVARGIHYNSRRSGQPFISVNCAALPETLVENEIFGHRRGGFTGADQDKRGLFEEAGGGTLFLDEIGELSLSVQTKLLRVLEYGEFRRIGDTEQMKADVRLIAATNRDLEKAIAAGEFREDLYYRLNVFPMNVPPLRERKEDIPLLASHFLHLHQDETAKRLEGFSPSAIQKLMFCSWPGNIRELENKVKQAMINAAGPLIYREDIDLDDRASAKGFKSFREAKREFERNYVANVLQITNGNVAEASRLSHKDRKDFYDLMRKHGIRSNAYRIR